jgi:Tol biopolymer transport system component
MNITTIKKTAFLFLLGSLLAISCKNKIPVKNGDPVPYQFENAVQLTFDVDDINPRWSPTGRKIAFVRRNYIYILDVESMALSFLMEGHSPTWSPGGQSLAFIRDSEIYTTNIDPGSEPSKVTIGAQAFYYAGMDWGGNSGLAYFQLGDTLYADYTLTIYWMSYHSYQLVFQKQLGYCEIPRWSEDGTKILFRSTKQDISIYDMEEDLVYSVIYWSKAEKPCWYSISDSTYILYIEGGILHRMNLDGTNHVTISDESFHPGSMDYSHHTRQLTFNHMGIWTMDFPPPDDEDDNPGD